MARVIHVDPKCPHYLQHIQQQQKHQHQHTSSQSHARRGGAQASDDDGLSFLERKRKEIIDRSMAALENALNIWLDNSMGDRMTGGVLGKRARGGSPEEEEHEVEGAGKGAEAKKGRAVRSTKKRVKKESDEEGPRLACPFCVHDPERYSNVKTCMGPGWPKAHRVKEHVYRSHAKPKNMCSRCYDSFEDEAALKQHQRAKGGCEVKDECDAPDGFTEAQEKLLRARSSGGTEEEKWQEMYRILFPEDEMKSPYYHEIVYNSSSDMMHKPGQAPAHFSTKEECKQYLLVEIARMARRRIEEAVDKELEKVQVTMDAKAADIVKLVQNKMMRTFNFVSPQVADGEEEDDAAGEETTTTHEAPLALVDAAQIPPRVPTPPSAGVYNLFDTRMNSELEPMLQQPCVAAWFDYTSQNGMGPAYGVPTFNFDGFYMTGKGVDYTSTNSNDDSAYFTSSVNSDVFGSVGYRGQ